MHDGFVSRRQLEVNDLEELIREKTGFSMKLDEDPIEVPPEMSFGNFLASKTLSAQDNPAVIAHYGPAAVAGCGAGLAVGRDKSGRLMPFTDP